MKKGGYKIIDFKGTALSGTAVDMTGIYDQIVDDYDKPIMVSGVILSGELQDDAYASVKVNDGSVSLTVYGGVITVTDDDEATFASAKSNTELTEEIIKKPTKTNYVVPKSGSLTLTGTGANHLPNRYILAFTGTVGGLNIIFMGSGYGAGADLRHFVGKIVGNDNPDITVTPSETVYGLTIANTNTTVDASLTVLDLD